MPLKVWPKATASPARSTTYPSCASQFLPCIFSQPKAGETPEFVVPTSFDDGPRLVFKRGAGDPSSMEDRPIRHLQLRCFGPRVQRSTRKPAFSMDFWLSVKNRPHFHGGYEQLRTQYLEFGLRLGYCGSWRRMYLCQPTSDVSRRVSEPDGAM